MVLISCQGRPLVFMMIMALAALSLLQSFVTLTLPSLSNSSMKSFVYYKILSPTNVLKELPALTADNVFVLDAVWVPPSSKIMLLAMTPKMFAHTSEFKPYMKAYNHTFPHEMLQSPITLLPHLTWNKRKIRACHNIRAEADDGNINDRMYIVECYVTQEDRGTRGVLQYKDIILAEMDSLSGKFNAANGYQFEREMVDNNTTSNTTKVSIAIKSISDYSPLIPDLMDYYQKQGVHLKS